MLLVMLIIVYCSQVLFSCSLQFSSLNYEDFEKVLELKCDQKLKTVSTRPELGFL